jgi:GntR family carbon starvation induced transcriptional regulator
MPRPALKEHDATLTAQAIARIRRDVLVGSLGPASKLRIRELAERYDLGVTPIREALAKLGAEGLVYPISNRGFAVPLLSPEDLADITATRCAIETEALRQAMKRGGDEWEAGIRRALNALRHHLKQGARTVDEADDSFDALHLAFHTALIAACGSPRLIMLHRHLYQQAFRYRAVVMKEVRHTAPFIEEHARLAKIVLGRRASAVTALQSHLELTYKVVYPESPANSSRSAKGRPRLTDRS